MANVLIVDADTNTVLERNETAIEAAQRDEMHVAYVAERDAHTATAAAAASGRAKLAALGLTDDEINALLGA